MSAEGVGAVVAGFAGVVAAAFSYRRGVRGAQIGAQVEADKLRVDSLNRYLDQVQEDNVSLRADVAALRDELVRCKTDCEREIAALRVELDRLRRS